MSIYSAIRTVGDRQAFDVKVGLYEDWYTSTINTIFTIDDKSMSNYWQHNRTLTHVTEYTSKIQEYRTSNILLSTLLKVPK